MEKAALKRLVLGRQFSIISKPNILKSKYLHIKI